MEDSQRNISSLVFDIEAVADGDLIARICAISVSLISLKRRFRGLPQRGLAPPQPNVDEAASFVNKTWNEVDEAGSSVYGRAPHKLPRLIMCAGNVQTDG